MPTVELTGIAHRGRCRRNGKTLDTVRIHAAAQGLLGPDTRWLARHLDDPLTDPEAQLNPRAGLSIDPGAETAPPLERFTVVQSA